MTDVFKKEKFGGRHYTGRTLCEDKGRDWKDASTRQRMSADASKPPEAGGEASRFSFTAPWSLLALSPFKPPDNNFLLLKSPSLWYTVMVDPANEYRKHSVRPLSGVGWRRL